MQTRTASITQQFTLNYYNGNYKLTPRASATNKSLTISGNCNANGLSVTLQSSPLASQLWTITRGNYGYRLAASSSSNGLSLSMPSYSTSLGASTVIWSYSQNVCDWIFEPVYSGNMSYLATTTLSSADSACANNIVTRFGQIGYNATRTDLPPVIALSQAVGSRALVIHGHGNNGFILLEQTDGTNLYFYSESPTASSSSLNTFFRANSWGIEEYVMFITCNSAAASTYRRSMVDVAYNDLGASCVTGFINTVAGGEDYLRFMSMYMCYGGNGKTLDEAFAYADSCYECDERLVSSCPANSSNRFTLGNTNKSIDMN